MKARATIHTDDVRRQVEQLRVVTTGTGGALRVPLERVGLRIAKWHQDNFAEGGTVLGKRWPLVSPITAMLRRGSKGQITDWSAAVRVAQTLHPLMDTGRLKISLQAGSSGGVFRVAPLSVEVGTNVVYADLHQKGGSSRFVFGSREQKIFDQNVPEALRGRPPATTRTGRKSRARRNWNRFHFIMRAVLRRKSGSSVRVPQRRLVFEAFNRTQEATLDRIFEEAVREEIRRRGL